MNKRLTSTLFEMKANDFLCNEMKMNSGTRYYKYILELLFIVFNHALKNEYCMMKKIYTELSQKTGLTCSTAQSNVCRFMSEFRIWLLENDNSSSFSKVASAYLLYKLVKIIDKRYGLEEI